MRLRTAFYVVVAAMTGFSAFAASQEADPLREFLERAVARVKPALVRIEVVWTEYEQGREIKYEASGSGVIIRKEGYIITNHHVAGHATRLLCVLADNEEIEATLVGTDPMSDISVIRLNSDGKREFPFVTFGNSDEVAVGDTALAMGSPMALSQSVTRGIISNTKMVMPRMFSRFEQFSLDGEDVGAIVRWIAHDAQIYGGNSGGPLVNLRGEIIGINEIRLGLAGAIPGNLAKEVARQLIANGKVQRSWLGIEVQSRLKSVDTTNGVFVGNVLPDSPADKAGLKPQDVITKLEGKEVNVRFDEEIPLFNQTVSDIPIGKEIEAVVLRGGKPRSLKITTAEREAVQPKTREMKQWGMTVRNISFLASKELKLDNTRGVLITSVRPGGPAGIAKPPVQSRDILVEVTGDPVNNVEELIAATDKIMAGKTKPTPVNVVFNRKQEKYLTVVNVGLKEIEDPGLEARKAWVPVATQAITREMAGQLGSNTLMGVRVVQVYTNSTAERAGIEVGDLILAIDDQLIAASQPGDEEVFTSMVRQYRIGATPELHILRDNKTLKLPVELVASPKLEREMKKFRDENFEFTARDLSFFDRVREDWSENFRGVLVTEVREGGWAALGSLIANDVVTAVNDEPVIDIADLQRKLQTVSDVKPKFVVLEVLRGIHTRYLELEPNWSSIK
jgi:serine protease Do